MGIKDGYLLQTMFLLVGVTVNFSPHAFLECAIVHGLSQVAEEATSEAKHTLSRCRGCRAAQVLTRHEGQVWEAVLIAGPPVQRLAGVFARML